MLKREFVSQLPARLQHVLQSRLHEPERRMYLGTGNSYRLCLRRSFPESSVGEQEWGDCECLKESGHVRGGRQSDLLLSPGVAPDVQ